jgi:hypothetical protein
VASATNKYTGLQVSVTNVGLVGIADLGLTVSGTVQVNKGPAGSPRLNWLEVAGDELATVTLEMDDTVELAAAGTVWVDLFGFLQVFGDFALSKFFNDCDACRRVDRDDGRCADVWNE